MSDKQYDDRIAGTYYADATDSRTLTEFCQWMTELSYSIPSDEGELTPLIRDFLRMRAEKRERKYHG